MKAKNTYEISVNKNRRNRNRKRVCSLFAAMLLVMGVLAGCGGDSTGSVNKEDLKQAGLGALVMLYDDTVWTYDESVSTENSLTFMKGDEALIGVSCSKENVYQHPMDMIEKTRMIYSTFEGYEELSEPAKIDVNGESWYELSYSFMEAGVENSVIQRFYGKNYYAYTMTYTTTSKDFEDNKQQALQVMNSAVMSVPDNAEAEAKAKEFLVGEWDMGASGYLVLAEDGTYSWYMQADKDEANMHKGTYGCDVENADLGFSEGQGIYLVLFPEVLYTDGEASTTGSAKYDYGLSLDQQSDGTYQMINVSNFNMYSLKKQ